MCCCSCRQFKVRLPMLGGRVADWMHLEDAIALRMIEAKLELFKNLLHFSEFSAHNCLKRQPRLTCRVVVCQFSGSAPIFQVMPELSMTVRSKSTKEFRFVGAL